MRMLCKIFESRVQFLNNKFKFNSRKCNYVSSFSGCIQGDKCKCITALPTWTEHVELFEKTLIGGFSSVYTRLAFDSRFFFPTTKNKMLKQYAI